MVFGLPDPPTLTTIWAFSVLLRMAAAQQADDLENLLDRSTLLGSSLSYYYNTMFGPLGASVGYSNKTKEPYFYINLGFVF
jgi:NTE family protein